MQANKKIRSLGLAAAAATLLTPFFGAQASQAFTLQGRLATSGNAPLIGSAVKIRVKIYSADPALHCALYAETHTVDLSVTTGLFSINLGEVNPARITREAPLTYSLDQVISNRKTLAVAGTLCSPVVSGTANYVPNPDDMRKVVIEFNDPSVMGSSWESIPEMDLNAIAYAMEARNLGGYPVSALLRVSDPSGNPANVDALTPAEADELGRLSAGTSSHYVAKGGTAGVQIPAGAPTTPAAGSIWFESGNLKYSDGINPPHTIGTSTGGTITGVTASTGLTGGGTSGSVALALSPSGVGIGATKGSASSVPQITYDTYGRITGVAEVAISGTVPGAGAAGEVLKSDGNDWTSAPARTADLKSTSDEGSIFPAVNCTAAQTMFWNPTTDKFECQAIALAAPPAAVANSYKLVTVAADGRVNGGSSPTTIDGFGITDALKNTNGVPNFAAGNTSGRPTAGHAGHLYVDTQALTLYRDNGTTWDVIGTAGAGGSLTGVTAGTGLMGGGSAGNVTVSLDTTGVAAVTNAVKVTTDAYGRVTGAGSLAASDIPSLDWAKITTGKPNTLGGYGISQSYVENGGSALSLSAGNTVGKGAFGTAGRIYIDTQANTVSYDTGAAWQTIVAGGGFTGSLGGEVSGAQGSTQVEKIGSFLRSTITSLFTDVQNATDAKTNLAIVKRDAAGGFAGGEITADTVTFKGATSGKASFRAPSTVSTNYTLELPAAAPGSNGQVLQANTAGVLSWVTPYSGSAINVVAPITNSSGTIGITQAATGTNGYLSSTDWNTFNNKQGTTLTSGNIWVGNGSSVATSVTPGGDLTMSNAGSFTVTKIRGTAVSATAPTLSGQVLRYSTTGTQYAPGFIQMSDLRSITGGSSGLTSSCGIDKTMSWDSVSDSITCVAIGNLNAGAITAGQLAVARGGTGVDGSSITQNFVFAAPAGGAGAPTFRALSAGDLPASASYWTSATGGINFAGGNVGIGTSSPSNLLSVGSGSPFTVDNAGSIVGGSLTVGGTAGVFGSPGQAFALRRNVDDQSLNISGGNAATTGAFLKLFGGSHGTSPNVLTFNSSGTETMRILPNGNVGIGVTSPQARLDVRDINTTNTYALYSRSTNTDPASTTYNGHFQALPAFTANGTASIYNLSSLMQPKVSSGASHTGSLSATLINNLRNNLGASGADSGSVANLNGSMLYYGHAADDAGATPATNSASGIRIYPYVQSGTITNMYDIYLSSLAAGGTVTNRYGIYSADANAKIYFAGNVGLGTTSPSAFLHLRAGTASAGSAPLKFSAGTSLTTLENGALEYDGTDLFLTSGGVRRKLASTAGANDFSGVGSITGSGALAISAGGSNQNITLAASGTGQVQSSSVLKVTNSAVSSSSTTGALQVAGGVGVTGDIYTGASVNAATQVVTPQIYGSSAASGTLKLDGTSDPAKGHLLLNSAGGNVGIGTTSPSYALDSRSTVVTNNTEVITGAFLGPGAKGTLAGYATDGSGAIKEGRLRAAGSVPLALGTTTTPAAIYILDNGSIGIGTTAPSTALQVNGTVTATSFAGNGAALTGMVRQVNVVTYSTVGSFTYSPPAGTLFIEVIVQGAGGGGGGIDGQGSGTMAASGGGGAGGLTSKFINAPSGSYTVVVGAKGAGGSSAAGAGSVGGGSSFSNGGTINLSATGGSGAGGETGSATRAASATGPAGQGSGGDVNASGSRRGYSVWDAGVYYTLDSVEGMESRFGVGGALVNCATGNEPATSSFGAGGGGVYCINTATNYAGGAGANGVVMIREYKQ